LLQLLIDDHARVNVQNAKGMSPLHIAAKKGFIKLVQFLIHHGADVQLVNSQGQTAFDLAPTEEMKTWLL